MSSFTKVIVSLLALYVTVQTLAGNLFPSGDHLPSGLGYLETLAEPDDRKIVILLTGNDAIDSCRDLEMEVIRTWEWSKFSRSEVVFENFHYVADEPADSVEMRRLWERFGDEEFPIMIVATSKGQILGKKTGYDSCGPVPIENWIRSL